MSAFTIMRFRDFSGAVGSVDRLLVAEPPPFTKASAVNLKTFGCVGCTGLVAPAEQKEYWGFKVARGAELAWLSNATPIKLAAQQSAFEICQNLLLARRGILSLEQFTALSRQIGALLSEDDENFETRQITVSSISFDGLVTFLGQHRPNSHPNIGLARNGHFTASWSPSRTEKVTSSIRQRRWRLGWRRSTRKTSS